jgi:hypothetical protein
VKWIPAALSPGRGVKRPGPETDYSPPSGAEVNAWSYTSTSPYVFRSWYLSTEYVFMAQYLVKLRESFTFT